MVHMNDIQTGFQGFEYEVLEELVNLDMEWVNVQVRDSVNSNAIDTLCDHASPRPSCDDRDPVTSFNKGSRQLVCIMTYPTNRRRKLRSNNADMHRGISRLQM